MKNIEITEKSEFGKGLVIGLKPIKGTW